MSKIKEVRYTTLLERIAFSVISVGVTVSAGFQWQLYKDQQIVLNSLKNHDARITVIEQEIAKINGNMVTWDTLKRIELYLASMDSKMANDAIINALKAETGSRKK